MTGQVAPEHALSDLQTRPCSPNETALCSSDSKRFSDLLVGVKHDSKGASHGSWWQVLPEGGSHEACISVVLDNLAPDALVVESGLGVLGLVDVCNALSMVPVSRFDLGDSLDLDKSLVGNLRSLSSFKTDEDCLSVKSTRINYG